MDQTDDRGFPIELGKVQRINGSYHFDWEIDGPDQSEKCQKNSKC
jgi:hypothetical protein